MAFLVSACKPAAELTQLSARACDLKFTAISDVQGTGELTPLVGQQLNVRGIVTHIEPSKGVYLEQAVADDSAQSSNGLLLSNTELTDRVSTGVELVVMGVAAELGDERNTVTALTEISGYRICGTQPILPLTRVNLPLSGENRESLEGMRLSFDNELVVTDIYRTKEGRLGLSMDKMLPRSTEIARPGADARTQSGKNRNALIRIQRLQGDSVVLPAGARINQLTGVLGHDGRQHRLLLAENLKAATPRQYPIAPPGENELRVVGFNLHNYFNGNGKGGGFPTERGAETPAEFASQRDRLSAAIRYMNPDLVAVMELENDGFGEFSAARDFADDLQAATGVEWVAVVPNDRGIGEDLITVGIFYRIDKLEAASQPKLLESVEFQDLSRIPLAQAFRDKTSGVVFTVAVNHLKSKGSCPDDGPNSNLGDGQGCWNLARTEAARAMSNWVRTIAKSDSQGRALILGDMNAYRMEDPIRVILEAGFKDLKASGPVGLEYTFIYGGEAGTLDYAFASSALLPFVHGTRILNINSPYPMNIELPQPWLGSSDHDPVVVDLRLRQSATPD